MKLQMYDNEDDNDAQDQQRYMRGRIKNADRTHQGPGYPAKKQQVLPTIYEIETLPRALH